jgi:hypothetical protein
MATRRNRRRSMKKRGGGSGSSSSSRKTCGHEHAGDEFKKIARHAVLKEVNKRKGEGDLKDGFNNYIEHLTAKKGDRETVKGGLTIKKEGRDCVNVFCTALYGAKGLKTTVCYNNVFIAQSEKSRQNK